MPKKYAEIDWYDLPRYYDMVFSLGTPEEADFLEEARRLYATTGGRQVLEPACGSGRLVVELARRGYSVTGFDLSQAMLDYARERLEGEGLRASLSRADMTAFSFRRKFDLAHCLVSTFKYILDEDGARSHLECVSRALKPGGIYVLGFHLSDYEDSTRCRERWVAAAGDLEVTCNIQSWPPDRWTRLERVRSRLIARQNGGESRSETHWEFRTYNARQTRELLRSVPTLEHVATYDMSYQLDSQRKFDDNQLDCVLILRRRVD